MSLSRGRRIKLKPTRREVASALDHMRRNTAGLSAHDADAVRVAARENFEAQVAKSLARTVRKHDPRAGSEHKEQAAVIKWWRVAHRNYKVPEFALYAVPNGGRRDAIGGARLKAEGVRPGIPDLCLDVPRGQYHGLRVEMKYGSNKESAAQIDALAYLRIAGYWTATCWTADEAIRVIEKYLKED